MEYHAGIDVAPERSRVCVVDATGGIVREAEATSGPEALVGLLRRPGVPLARAGPPSRWPRAGLTGAGPEAAPPEARHVAAALPAVAVEADRQEGIHGS